MWTAGFPEPHTFSLRVAKLLAARTSDFDVVHDNQCLGYGLLDIAQRLPLVATIHHPIIRDRQVDLAAAPWRRKPFVRRWYGFLDMQQRVARQIPHLITVSSSSAEDIVADFDVARSQLDTVPLGVDTELFRPRQEPRIPGRIVAVASADKPLKGIGHLLKAVAQLRHTREVHLQLVAKLETNGPTEKLIAELGLTDIVTATSGLSDDQLAELLASAEIACIPSMYEGFSLPAVEAMASGTPLVASHAGALPEVVGNCGEFVAPGDVDAMTRVLGDLLDHPVRRHRLGALSRHRALETFAWSAVAARTVAVYEQAIDRYEGRTAAALSAAQEATC